MAGRRSQGQGDSEESRVLCCGGCQRTLPSYDTHSMCLACLEEDHDMYKCSICSGFPKDLFEARLKGMNYKKDYKKPKDESWPLHFFAIFTSLDSPTEGLNLFEEQEEDEEEEYDTVQSDVLVPNVEEQRALISDASFQAMLRKFREERDSSDLTLPSQLSPLKNASGPSKPNPTPKRPAGKGEDRSSKKAKLEEEEIVITHVSQPPTSVDDRLSSLEKLVGSLASSVQQFINPQTPQKVPSAAGVPGTEPVFKTRLRPNTSDTLLGEEELSDAESAVSKTPTELQLNVKEKRVLWLQALKESSPELQHHTVSSSGRPSAHFSHFVQEESKLTMPFCPLFAQEISTVAKKKEHDKVFKKSPFTLVDKYYPTVEPQESTILQPREVPRCLLDEVKSTALTNPGASGLEAKLKLSLPEGQQDEAASRIFNQSASMIRLINSQELAIQGLSVATKALLAKIEDIIEYPEVPVDAMNLLEGLKDTVSIITAGTDDLEQGNRHMSRCTLLQYNNALRAKQKAWLASTNLPNPLQQEVLRSDLDVPKGSSTDPLSLLGEKGSKLVTDHFQKLKDDKFRDWTSQKSQASRGKKSRRPPFRPQQQQRQPPLSQAAAAAGWAIPSFPPRGRGRGSGRGNRGGRGGKSGFSASPASKPKE